MKRLFRNTFTAVILSPLILRFYLRTLFTGRRKAVASVGPALTRIAKNSLRFWIPDLDGPEDFGRFATVMKSRLRISRPLYDVAILEDTRDIFRIRVDNCPVCDVLKAAGIPELRRYACEGDWAKARENSDKWSFAREHQIGTGDTFCDQTYMRKS